MPAAKDEAVNAGISRRLSLDDGGVARLLFGPNNANLHLLERLSEVAISARGTELTLKGEAAQVELLAGLLEDLYAMARVGRQLIASDFEQAYRLKALDRGVPLRDVFMDTVMVSSRRRMITPQGLGQKRYIDAIRCHDIVFGIGPAGTGKTYLAMAMAVATLKNQAVQRIVITRPAVEAGEKLGFLPGDLAEKVNPYLRPLYDALHDMIDPDQVARLIERGTIEVAPLAFMRGRTLNDSFIILDEAQNTTSDQMKMFLTRLGFESKAVITGDITQVDLPAERASGLIEARIILSGIEGMAFCEFSETDVVRHPLVRDVIRAYERHERSDADRGKGGKNGKR
jgi:phosphate starvation-inducible PhoH-like protein